ncbi:phospholipase D-like domain-containing protein [Sphingomicrobium lutaoense]|uniref:Phospholipase D n=1 Tax=Sphingomicrobium lutaoense TaxID=515949 RepID=A0A839Z238_9SPHN|nr:phosphatidylserine/phosphatidylglycerophosphate/cardiolipin synthase family protein [Sphingomicrobium lutaoense]MBB3764628.1 cardiolipin synthase [Sphingomicrobium lutaoense]
MARPPKSPDPAAPLRHEVAGHELRLLDSGKDRFDALIERIDGAQKSLRLLFYMFLDDEAGQKVLEALVRAARRGVEVRLIIDSFGSSKTPDDYYRPVREAGGDYLIFHPRIGRRYFIRNHQKLLIADERHVIVGGANIGNDYLDDHERAWRDLWIELSGPSAAHIAAYFDALDAWARSPRPLARRLRELIIRYSQTEGPIQWVLAGPLPRHNPWPGAVAREIVQAERVDLVAAYFSPTRHMLWRLGRVARRGGQTRILTAAKSDNEATIAAARHTYSRLLRMGARMWEYQRCRLHSKLLVIDDAVHVGSSNFDFRSLRLNLEVMLRIEDADFARTMRQWIDRELEDSVEITPEKHRRRANWWRRFKWALSHWLVTTIDYTVSRRLNFNLSED